MKKSTGKGRVFDTDKRIRLGIWGLGRGMSFYSTCKFLNIDVVAGCDYNEHMRENFLKANPGAFATADADEFLAQDFDAVLLATFCVKHAPDAIKCLRAGKHVLSEVTSFFNMAEGVQLVEAVEKSGLIYNLAENYPFTAPNMYLARKWREGLFGDLMYAEYEYVHEIRELSYTYIDGVPVKPGNTVHSWRSWMNFHYYCTHSLGPIMVITGTRPTRVVSLPGKLNLAGYLVPGPVGMGGITPSLINMDNGSVVRNLMGSTTNDTHVQRLWGTLGAAELNVGRPLKLRLGGSGNSPMHEVTPRWDSLGELAAGTGHGGGDFWTLYYFARQIFTGEKGPFDIYSACDVTIPGILAFRSSMEDGRPYKVPDFRNKAEREEYRNDHWQQEPYDYKKGVFPVNADFSITGKFTETISKLSRFAKMYRAWADWKKVKDDMVCADACFSMLSAVVCELDKMRSVYAEARKIVDAYPDSDGARVLIELLELGDEKTLMSAQFPAKIKREFAALKRKYPHILKTEASALIQTKSGIKTVKYPDRKIKFSKLAVTAREDQKFFIDIRPVHKNKHDGIVYVKCLLTVPSPGKRVLGYAADGPVKIWVNGKKAGCEPDASNPLNPPRYQIALKAKKKENELMFAMKTNSGKAWGIILCLPA